MKICSKCKEEKGVGEFHKAKTNKDGLKGQCRQCYNKHYKQYRIALKKTIFDHYGFCACCEESNLYFLTIDHINNNGAEHKRSIGRPHQGGTGMYYWIIKNNFPSDLQSLCYNCNCAKHHSGLGFCPHELDKQSNSSVPQTPQPTKNSFHHPSMYPTSSSPIAYL